jgi:aarF domain-containing kinase
MAERDSKRSRATSLLKTLGGTALRAGQDAMRRHLGNDPTGEWVSHAAEHLVQGLDELKGAAMKFGQMLSLLDESTLPPGWKKALSLLQSRATALPWEKMEPVLDAELGPKRKLFAHIEPVAVRAASIGQVHMGKLRDGRKVAVKIRYPGLDENLKTDVENLRAFFRKAEFLIKSNFDPILDELEGMFLHELDFKEEANQYRRYAGLLKDEQDSFVVPNVVEECSVAGVLTTEWLEGEDLNSWISRSERESGTADDRSLLGERILRLVFLEIFRFGCIQSDPNPGNFIILPDKRIGLVDFGAVKELCQRLVDDYRSFGMASIAWNEPELLTIGRRMGFLPKEASSETEDLFLQILRLSSTPFRDESYTWDSRKLSREVRDLGVKYALKSRLHTPPSEAVFLQRRVMGTELVLERLQPTLAARGMFEQLAGVR